MVLGKTWLSTHGVLIDMLHDRLIFRPDRCEGAEGVLYILNVLEAVEVLNDVFSPRTSLCKPALVGFIAVLADATVEPMICLNNLRLVRQAVQ